MSDAEAATLPSGGVDRGLWRQALLITFGAVLLRLIFAALLPLFPDETYYWDWSRHIDGGYFDHPPAIAVLIRAGTWLFASLGLGLSPLAVRFFPVLAGGLASLGATLIARRLGGGSAARFAAVAFAVMPLAASGLVLATPDAPLLAAAAFAMHNVAGALDAPVRSPESLQRWVNAGLFLGLAFSSKYTSILLPVSLLVAILVRPTLRARLREPGPYIACIVATFVFVPVLYWNATHEWISFRFQLQHGLGAPSGSAIKRELDLLGGQLALVSPILFALAAWSVWRALRSASSDVRFTLGVIATGSWAFFAYSALRRPVEANWPAPSYIPAIALLAAGISMAKSESRERRWLKSGVALAAVMSAVIYVHSLVPLLPLPARRDPIARSAGWDRMTAQVREARRALGPRTWVGADRYQDVSELAYHLPDHPPTFCVCLSGRHNQYELWPTFPLVAMLDDDLILALDETAGTHDMAARLAPHFARVRRGAVAPLLRGGDTVSVRRIWILEGYRGGWPVRDGR